MSLIETAIVGDKLALNAPEMPQIEVSFVIL
jgi:hypothetical protein